MNTATATAPEQPAPLGRPVRSTWIQNGVLDESPVTRLPTAEEAAEIRQLRRVVLLKGAEIYQNKHNGAWRLTWNMPREAVEESRAYVEYGHPNDLLALLRDVVKTEGWV